MKKVVYISADFFFDVDIPVLDYLSGEFALTWLAIIPHSFGKERRMYLRRFSNMNNIKLIFLVRKGSKSSIENLRFNYEILKRIKSERADLIYIEDLGDLIFNISTLFIRNKKIFAIHDVLPHSSSDLMFYRKLYVFLSIRIFPTIHVFSKSQQSLFGKKVGHVHCIPMCSKSFGFEVTEDVRIEGRLKLLFFGRIKPYKGLDFLLTVLAGLEAKYQEKITLTIAGKGSLEGYIELLNSLGSIKVVINNEFISDVEGHSLFSEYHVFVCPYYDVTQSGPILNAMTYNMPSIVSNLPGFKDYIVSGQNGYIYSERNELESLLELMIEKLGDEDYWSEIKMKTAALRDTYFSQAVVGKNYVDLFNKTIESKY